MFRCQQLFVNKVNCNTRKLQTQESATMSETHTLQATDTTPKDKAVTGRPTMFSETLAAVICGRIATGDTLTKICKTKGFPVPATVHRWRRENSQFRADYDLARDDQMDGWGDEIVAIADDNSLDTIDSVDKQGNAIQVANHANVQRDRLRIDTRKFLMAKINGQQYGDKVEHQVRGKVDHIHSISDRERMRRLALFFMEDEQAGALIESTATEPESPQADTLPNT
jgi:hypothetical protein